MYSYNIQIIYCIYQHETAPLPRPVPGDPPDFLEGCVLRWTEQRRARPRRRSSASLAVLRRLSMFRFCVFLQEKTCCTLLCMMFC